MLPVTGPWLTSTEPAAGHLMISDSACVRVGLANAHVRSEILLTCNQYFEACRTGLPIALSEFCKASPCHCITQKLLSLHHDELYQDKSVNALCQNRIFQTANVWNCNDTATLQAGNPVAGCKAPRLVPEGSMTCI